MAPLASPAIPAAQAASFAGVVKGDGDRPARSRLRGLSLLAHAHLDVKVEVVNAEPRHRHHEGGARSGHGWDGDAHRALLLDRSPAAARRTTVAAAAPAPREGRQADAHGRAAVGLLPRDGHVDLKFLHALTLGHPHAGEVALEAVEQGIGPGTNLDEIAPHRDIAHEWLVRRAPFGSGQFVIVLAPTAGVGENPVRLCGLTKRRRPFRAGVVRMDSPSHIAVRGSDAALAFRRSYSEDHVVIPQRHGRPPPGSPANHAELAWQAVDLLTAR